MATDWTKMTINQLKTELSQRSLDATGKKAELVARIEEYEKSEEAMLTDDPEETTTEQPEETEELETNGQEQEEEEEAKDEEEAMEEDKVVVKEEPVEDGNVEVKEEVTTEVKVEKEVKKPVDLGPDYSKSATGFVVALDTGKKMVIPSKETIRNDLKVHSQPKVVFVFPIKTEDLASGVFQTFFESCIHFHITFHEHHSEKEKSTKGYIEFTWASVEQATEQAELLSQVRDDLEVRHLTVKDRRADIPGLPKTATSQESMLKKYLYIGNLPATATDQAVHELFPDALRLCVISNEEGLPKGYALAEMPTEESCDRALKMYMNVAFGDSILYLLRAWQKVPKGLLDDETRTELLKKIKQDRQKMLGRMGPIDAYAKRKIENEMTMTKARLDKDCKVREELSLPVPPDIIRRESLIKDLEEKRSKERDDKDDKKPAAKKFIRTPSVPYKRPVGIPNKSPRGRRGGGPVPSLVRGGRSSGQGYNPRSYGGGNQNYGYQEQQQGYHQRRYSDQSYEDQSYEQEESGDYSQAVQMLVQVSKMLGQGQSPTQGSGGYGGMGGGRNANSSSYGGASSSYGGTGYGSGSGSGFGGGTGTGYGLASNQRKRQAADDGFGGGKRGPGMRNMRRW